jgi:hypothetical protein
MKNIIYLVLALCLLACYAPKAQESNSPQQWLTFEGKKKHIVLVSGDEEYRSEEALPQLAKILSKKHGFKCTVLFAQNPDEPGIVNPNYLTNIPGLEHLASADMMIIFTRFRALPDEQMEHINNFLMSGKPVLGIRTATHAFNFNKKNPSPNWEHYRNGYNGDKSEWADGFGRLVLGEKWQYHHGHHKHQSTKGLIAEGAEKHPITNGIEDGDVWASTDVYGVRLPLPGDSQPIILGQVINRKGDFDENDIFYGMKPSDDEVAGKNNKGMDLNNPMMPVAWTKSYQLPGGKKGKVFTSTVGASADLLSEGVRRLLVNGTYWALDMKVPKKAKVDLVGNYTPTQYAFRSAEYWEKKQLKVSDLK